MSGPNKELGAELNEIEIKLKEVVKLLNTPQAKADHKHTNYLKSRVKRLTADKAAIERLQRESGIINADKVSNLNDTDTDSETDTDR